MSAGDIRTSRDAFEKWIRTQPASGHWDAWQAALASGQRVVGPSDQECWDKRNEIMQIYKDAGQSAGGLAFIQYGFDSAIKWFRSQLTPIKYPEKMRGQTMIDDVIFANGWNAYGIAIRKMNGDE